MSFQRLIITCTTVLDKDANHLRVDRDVVSADCKKYIFFIHGHDLLSLPRSSNFLRKRVLRLMLWIKASVILRVDITVEKEIERTARDQRSNDQN